MQARPKLCLPNIFFISALCVSSTVAFSFSRNKIQINQYIGPNKPITELWLLTLLRIEMLMGQDTIFYIIISKSRQK